ncbi:MAG TPA: fumarylacetoacetase [Gammaproteobacteria bacterium]|nr:fumarylacetoacetase [Gammaproteobacteria bacterium]
MSQADPTTEPTLRSWIESANRSDCDFPVQNLPYGVFSTRRHDAPRVGVAIGDQVLDLAALETEGLIEAGSRNPVFSGSALNPFMALGPEIWRSVRARLSTLLCREESPLRNNAELIQRALTPLSDAILHRPFEVKGYSDFYASREHATNVGKMFRGPDRALLPNWLHMPVAYNGRASTVVVSGTDVRRPAGQIKPEGSDAPIFSPCRKLDFELEMGAVVGTGNPMGEPVTIERAREMIFGYVLLNDWSARDIQLWEYQPLGPFLAKAFATTISPWVVTSAALEPFRVPGPEQAPEPLRYLRQSTPNNYDIHMAVALRPNGSEDSTTVTRTNFRHMYWSAAQQLAHHAIGGCAMQTGDLLGSGTVSGAEKESFGSLLELTWNGKTPLKLEDGETRTFIEDGDTVTFTGWAEGEGYRIGFGECRGTILPAHRVNK